MSEVMDWAYKNTVHLVKDFHTAAHCITTGGEGTPPFISASFSVDGLSFLIGMAIARYENDKGKKCTTT
jgi:hypothetical protein